VLTGSIWFYFQGHKDNEYIKGLSYSITFIGWLILFFSLVGQFLLKEAKIPFKKNKLKWLKRNVIHATAILTFCGLVMTNITVIDYLTDYRLSETLNNQPTNKTVATIIKIESRNSRGGPKLYAIIKYTADNRTFEQALFNYSNQYSAGQTYELEYSVEYPEMFRLIRLLK
jgi:hypothetical protein